MKRSILSAAILGFGLAAASTAYAANYTFHLCTGEYTKTMSDGNPVKMWGYAKRGSSPNICPTTGYTSPGPRIIVPADMAPTDRFRIRLHNNLPRPTSLVIPGALTKMSPSFFTYNGEKRVLSFDTEAAALPAGGAITNAQRKSYDFYGLAPGSYLYHSGTHPQVQVQMGLFGAVTRDHIAGQAYAGHSYNNEVVLVYSEIDPAIHACASDPTFAACVAGNNGYGANLKNNVTAAAEDMQSTIDYAPKYFVIDIDGDPGISLQEAGDVPSIKIQNGTVPLVRFFNASQRIHVPTIYEGRFNIIAEDGKLYPTSREQYTVDLAPLKTKDAFLGFTSGPAGGTFRLSDGAMALSNPWLSIDESVTTLGVGDIIANGSDNGMVLNFSVQASEGYNAPVLDGDEPSAVNDQFTVLEGGSASAVLANAMSNDSIPPGSGTTASILSYPSQGQLVANGSDFEYLHDGGEQGQDSMVYALTNAAGESSIAGVIINVAPVNDPPVANDDSVQAIQGQTIEIRALANDQDVDSRELHVVSVDSSSLGILNPAGQVIIFEAGQTIGSETIGYTMADDAGATATASLELNVLAAPEANVFTGTVGAGTEEPAAGPTGTAPYATDDYFRVVAGDTLDVTGNAILSILANDSPGATVDTRLVQYPDHGAIQMFADGTFIYAHDGTETSSDAFVYEVYNQYGTATATVVVGVAPKVVREAPTRTR